MVTHLDHRSDAVRNQKSAEILKVIPYPLKRTVLLGDFNCRPPGTVQDVQATEPVARILEKFEDTQHKPGQLTVGFGWYQWGGHDSDEESQS